MIDVEKVVSEAALEINRLGEARIALDLPLIRAVQMVAQVQLALRHPGNAHAAWARELCNDVIALIGKQSPLLADFCRLGFDPNFDMGSTPK